MQTLTPAAIYSSVFAGETVRVHCDSTAFPSLRVAVAKRHTNQLVFEITTQKLSAKWADGIATFVLVDRTPARGYTIVEMPDAKV